MIIGPAIKSARIKMGLSQTQLADRLGIERNHISKLENGHHEPTLELLDRIGDAIGIEGWRILKFASKDGVQSLTRVIDPTLNPSQHL